MARFPPSLISRAKSPGRRSRRAPPASAALGRAGALRRLRHAPRQLPAGQSALAMALSVCLDGFQRMVELLSFVSFFFFLFSFFGGGGGGGRGGHLV